MAEGLVAYAVLPAGHAPPPSLLGLDDQPVRAEEADGLALWVSAAAGPPTPDAEAAAVHHRVLEAALARGVTPVPLRFGQWLAGRDEVRETLARHGDAWRAALERLAGRVEVGVRAGVPAADPAARSLRARPRQDGTSYMRALLREHEARRAEAAEEWALAAVLEEAGAAWIRDQRVEILRGPAAGLSAAYLVDRGDAGAIKEALTRVLREQVADDFAVTGPWPPYSFA